MRTISKRSTGAVFGDAGRAVGRPCPGGGPGLAPRLVVRGERLDLEFLVKKHTQDSARAYGLTDRGLLAPGFRADINIIDFDRLQLRQAEVVYDLPAGGKRLMQRADGYRHTFVAGTEIVQDDEHTGALPGRLLR